ncbi:ArsR/SmtB family transcription factor [Catellatospora bangladeshensis]|uniref:ArsR/SmtB family transcription factor n=1 Tax=Catellatospora bangladeshensis TaxID=310355 RepID=UPI001EF1F071|nr:metalloregulator ArsR/SmtB family transcription factor [Catellatospora bangladeshensis]
MVISVSGDAPGEVVRLLADPARAAIVDALAAGPACTCHLVDDLGLTQPNISNHLRALRHAGVVKAEPYGRYTYYHLNADALEAAAAHLTDLAARARASSGNRREC